jgi:hypothetical protein
MTVGVRNRMSRAEEVLKLDAVKLSVIDFDMQIAHFYQAKSGV